MNLVETYKSLALAAPGTRVDERPEWTWVTGTTPVSFCNFVARFDLCPSQVEQSIPLFRDFARRAKAFWLFVTDYETPVDLGSSFLDAGFEVRQSLTLMGQAGGGLGGVEDSTGLERFEATGLGDRFLVARFMTDTFFHRSNLAGRDFVTDATAHSKHRLIGWRDGRGLVMAVMLSQSPRSCGLYNLCVRPDAQMRGFGGEAVRHCLAVADGLPLVLQCDSDLVAWYARLGFDELGQVRAFGVPG